MIFLLHGDNTTNAYARLLAIIEKYKTYEKIYLESSQISDLQTAIGSSDLFGSQKIIIAENFIAKQKLKAQDLKEIETSNILVLWEKKELTRAQANSFAKIATVEIFKLPPALYNFLDSLTMPASVAIKMLEKLDTKEKTSITWHISNRLCLLVLAKQNASELLVSKVTGRFVADWQLNKAKNQASAIGADQLEQLFLANLKIDYLTKTGATNIPQKTLISLMLIKYLPN